MKTQLRYFFVLLGTLLCSVTGYSQLNYTQNFNANAGSWDNNDFFRDDYLACDSYSLIGSFYYYDYPDWGFTDDVDAEVISPLLGTSNGQLATLSYSYKLLNYNTEDALSNSPAWGSYSVYWGTSTTGPWTLLHTVNPSNHVVSATCATKTGTFTPPNGSEIYLRVFGDNGNIEDTDVLLYMDNISLTQVMLACNGTPPAAVTKSSSGLACNTESFTLSFTPGTTSSGITHQWQSSTDGITYTDIAGATSQTYTATQTATKWYRANITCTASAATTTTTPIRVVNNGTNCYCKDIEFAYGVEPITQVTFAGINNTSSASLNDDDQFLQDFTGLAAGNVIKGQSYPITLKGNTGGSFTNSFKAYIDFNHNGSLSDPGEGFELGYIEASNGTDGAQLVANIAIPSSALTGITLMRIVKHYVYDDMELPEYLPTSCGADENTGYGQAEDYLLDIQPCPVLPPTADASQSFCAGATLSSIVVTGTTVKWYAAETGGSALAGNLPLVSGTTYYATSTSACESSARTAVTVTINNPVADDPADVVTCTDYVLPELSNGTYHTEPGGLGDTLAAGATVNADTTLYVYNTVGTCSAENSFTVTIVPFEVDQLDDVTVCSEYILPQLTSGSYYSEASGLGQIFQPGSAITETAVIYVYGVSEDNSACTAETSFTVTVVDVVADEMDDVQVCDLYTLPELSEGNTYHTQTGGAGTTLPAGSVINSSMTIYVYAQSATLTECTDETSFTVTVAPLETPEDLAIVLEGTTGTDITLADLEIYTELQGTVAVYATQANAEDGEEALSPSTVVTDGATYYATVTVGDCTSEPFAVTVDIVLGTQNFDMANFNYHPNPVKDVLTLSYSENITGVEVYNLVGQKVQSGKYNSEEVQLNLSQLASGTYLVKLSTEHASKTIKVIRE
ncbi:MAG: hypothetical protein DI539_03500 [Flavobacterium psychrophilum]|nr:MAG: hypothetical protein DI539_03500 [Flavobacterium psychrophilum]